MDGRPGAGRAGTASGGRTGILPDGGMRARGSGTDRKRVAGGRVWDRPGPCRRREGPARVAPEGWGLPGGPCRSVRSPHARMDERCRRPRPGSPPTGRCRARWGSGPAPAHPTSRVGAGYAERRGRRRAGRGVGATDARGHDRNRLGPVPGAGRERGRGPDHPARRSLGTLAVGAPRPGAFRRDGGGGHGAIGEPWLRASFRCRGPPRPRPHRSSRRGSRRGTGVDGAGRARITGGTTPAVPTDRPWTAAGSGAETWLGPPGNLAPGCRGADPMGKMPPVPGTGARSRRPGAVWWSAGTGSSHAPVGERGRVRCVPTAGGRSSPDRGPA